MGLCVSFLGMSPYVRTIKTSSGKKAVQIVWETHYGKRKMTHIGTASSSTELDLLRVKAKQVILKGQTELDIDPQVPTSCALAITSFRLGSLLDALSFVYDRLGFDKALSQDKIFKNLVIARIIEPTSKSDSLRVLREAGAEIPSYATLKRRLSHYSELDFRNSLSTCCTDHANLSPNALILFDVTTLYYECHQADDFRKPGYSKERRLEPQIIVALLTDRHGFPLTVSAFEGNRAETKTILPVLESYATLHKLKNLTVVADAGMLSYGNLKAIDSAGFSFIVGLKTPEVPLALIDWYNLNPPSVWTHTSKNNSSSILAKIRVLVKSVGIIHSHRL